MSEETVIGLSSLSPNPGARKKRKRLGIGEGSGNGKTCGKGHKGQNSRSGCKRVPGFEGGQMPLHRRLPKVGFTSRKRVLGKNTFGLISVRRLVELDGEITLDLLRSKGMLGKNARLKIVSGIEIDKKLVVEAHAVTASAKEAIEKAGGEIRILAK